MISLHSFGMYGFGYQSGVQVFCGFPQYFQSSGKIVSQNIPVITFHILPNSSDIHSKNLTYHLIARQDYIYFNRLRGVHYVTHATENHR